MTINLFNNDCLDIYKQINKVDLVLCDPPYGTTKCKWDSIIPLDEMWSMISHVCHDRTAIILTSQSPFDKILACSNLGDFRYEWIYEKGNATGFFNAKKMPLKAHENILVFYKKLPTYNPQITEGHERKVASRKTANSECYGKAVEKAQYDSTSRYPRSVQKFSSDKYKNNHHPTQKPLLLAEYLIKSYTNPGDTVFDFAMGSGTFGLASKKLGRKFIGIEKDKDYFDIANKRISDYLA